MIKVSVLMPMRNAAPYVLAAIQSVLQTDAVGIELLVIDDGSTDASRSVVMSLDDPRITLLDGPCCGIAACLNLGIQHATGEYVMRCDADDLFPLGRLEFQVNWLESHVNHIALCGGFEMINRYGARVANPFQGNLVEELDISPQLMRGDLRTSLCTFCIRRISIISLHGFRSFFETAEDIDFALRLGAVGKVAFISNSTYLYRIHGDSITHTQPNSKRVFFEEIAKKFAMQRLETGADDLMRGEAVVPPISPDKPNDASQHVIGLMIGNSWVEFDNKNYIQAIRVCARTIVESPFSFPVWINFAKIVAKIFIQPFKSPA